MGELKESKTRSRHKAAGEHFDKYFPNLVNRIYVLNAPTIVYYFLKAISLFMSKKQYEKFVMLKTDYHQRLDEDIGLENLPKCIGGTNPIPLGEYQNVFDRHFEVSWEENRIGLSKN